MDNHYHAHRYFLFTQMMMHKMVTFLMKNHILMYRIIKFLQQEMCHRCKMGQMDINHQQTVLYF
jgi:hypothetical protein